MKRAGTFIVLGLIFLSQTLGQNPPTISALCPASVQLVTPAAQNFNLNLTILGSGFQPDAIVLLYPGTTSQVTIRPAALSATVIRAVVPATLLPVVNIAAGSIQIQSIPVAVSSGGLQSAIVNITIGTPSTRFCALDPDQTTAGVATFRSGSTARALSGVTVSWTNGTLTGSVQNAISDPSGTALDVTLPAEALLTSRNPDADAIRHCQPVFVRLSGRLTERNRHCELSSNSHAAHVRARLCLAGIRYQDGAGSRRDASVAVVQHRAPARLQPHPLALGRYHGDDLRHANCSHHIP